MKLLIMILTPVLFIGAVGGLTHFLTSYTKRDAERWLVDRRVSERRKAVEQQQRQRDPDRRHLERRKGEPEASRR